MTSEEPDRPPDRAAGDDTPGADPEVGSGVVTVAVVDDHDVVHAGIDAWFAQSDPPIRVVHTATDAASGGPDRLARAGRVDVVVLDLYLGAGRPDLVLLRDLVAAGHRVVVFSGTTDPGVVLDCLDLGAAAFLTKTEGRAHLQAAVLAAAGDQGYIGPVAAGAMADDQRPRRPKLSPREREVLLSWFRTESKDLVAASLHIATPTVNTHLARIRAKYAEAGRPAPTKAALIARALQDGIVTMDELDS